MGRPRDPFVMVRLTLPDDRRVVAMSDELGIDPFALCGHLAFVWAWAGSEADGDFVSNVTPSALDRKARLPGLAVAMEAVGWLAVSADGLTFHNLRERNYEPGKSSKPSAVSMRKRRERDRAASTGDSEFTCEPEVKPSEPVVNGQCSQLFTPSSHEVHNEFTPIERLKNVEVEKEKPPKPPKGGVDLSPEIPRVLDSEEGRAVVRRWIAYRREIKKPLTPSSAQAAVKKLAGYGAAGAARSVEESIANGWRGLFPPPDDAARSPPARASPDPETSRNKVRELLAAKGLK